MNDRPGEASTPSTPEPTAAQAQSREGVEDGDVRSDLTPQDRADYAAGAGAFAGRGRDYDVGQGVTRATVTRPYERQSRDPIYRPLRIFALDPAARRSEGATSLLNVPYEPLQPGPVGAVFEVDNWDPVADVSYPQLDLEDPHLLIGNGRKPSPSDPLFHQQQVYAVCSSVYAAFRMALGRDLAWGFDRPGSGGARLRLRPHAFDGPNAHYDPVRGELCFGYYRAETVAGRNLPRGTVFTCLSHDVVVHEVTHALLDGLCAQLRHPSSADVLAFHEAFADLVAIFQHFSYEEVLRGAIRRSRGDLERDALLVDLARQFGETTSGAPSLRTAFRPGRVRTYDPERGPHELGAVLVEAIFDAFVTVFRRRTARFLRLATNGTGVLTPPDAELPADLQEILAREASKLAGQFLSICIRAIDYCPPVDVRLGEYLRAIITADHDLVPDDPWGYRETLIEAFARRRIYPADVENLAEDALLWRPPDETIADIKDLSFATLRFEGDPSRPAGERELRRQACVLGRQVANGDASLRLFGCARLGHPGLRGDRVDLPRIESIRSSRRVGPDRQVIFDLVAEVTQRRVARQPDGRRTMEFYGGATVILDPQGRLRYVIRKSVLAPDRLDAQWAFARSRAGRRYWQLASGRLSPVASMFRSLHAPARE